MGGPPGVGCRTLLFDIADDVASVWSLWLLLITALDTKAFSAQLWLYAYPCVRAQWKNMKNMYRKVSNIRRTLVGNKIVDHSDVVGVSPVGAAPTTSSFST